jgi:hypothetical protein
VDGEPVTGSVTGGLVAAVAGIDAEPVGAAAAGLRWPVLQPVAAATAINPSAAAATRPRRPRALPVLGRCRVDDAGHRIIDFG